MAYIIKEHFRGPKARPLYISAPPGYAARHDGTIYRDGTDPCKSGPEWNQDRNMAYEFATHRAAARVANICHKAAIVLA